GEARWTLSAPGGQPHLDARFTSLRFANADAAGQLQARFQADLHRAGLGRLDLSGRLDRAAVPSIPRYLPTSIGAALRGYLAHAFLAGDTRRARFDIHGRLPDLPYPHGPDTDGAPHEASVFRISAPFAHGKVDLSPHPAIILANGDEERWPAFDDVAGRFFVDGRQLGFDVTGGHYRGVQVNALAGRIADLGDTTRDLLIDGTTAGPLDDYLHYVNASPLGYWSGRAAEKLHAQGPATLKLHLAVPRRRAAPAITAANAPAAGAAPNAASGPAATAADVTAANVTAMPRDTGSAVVHAPAGPRPVRVVVNPLAAIVPAAPARIPSTRKNGMHVAGTLSFDHDHLESDRLPPLDALVGQVDFTEHTARTTGLHARLLGGDIDASGNLQGDGSVDVRIGGRVTPQVMLSQLDTARDGTHAGANRLSPAIVAGLRRLSGTTGYQGELHRVGHGEPTFHIASDLVGLGVDLPAPLGKAAPAAMPLALDWRALAQEDGGTTASGADAGATLDGPALLPAFRAFQRASRMPTLPAPLQRIDVSAGPVHAVYLRRGGKTPEVLAGAIAVNRPPAMPRHGVTAAVALERFDADAWRAVASAFSAATAGATGGVPADAAAPVAAIAAAPLLTPAGTKTATDTAAQRFALPAPVASPAAVASAVLVPAPFPFAPDDGTAGTAETAANGGAGAGAGAGMGMNAGADRRPGVPLVFAAPGHAPERASRFHPGGTAPAGGMAQWLPSRFDIDVGELTLLSRRWNDLVVTGNRNTMQGWEAQITSRQVAGAAEWQPQGGGAIHARFSKLTVPAEDPALARAAALAASSAAPPARPGQPVRHFPAIDLSADDVMIGTRRLGRLELLAHNIEAGGAPVWRVDRFALGTPAAQLLATGNWRTTAQSRNAPQPESDTDVAFQLAVRDGGAMLDQLGMPNLLRGGTGTVDGAVHWHGTPTRIDMPTLDGQVAADLKRGQILKVHPGAARLLGIVNLQGLARFMQLDFKGIFGKGLAFDRLSASGQIAHGIVTVGDGRLTTLPANVMLSGTADLPAKRQDLHVTVVPNLNAGSASIAVAVVNPLLGLSSLVAQMALSEPLSRSLTRHYAVTGAWSAPHVQRTDGNRGNMPPATALPPD
ncbi:MAG: YhdP family phospholipid transporter, partial [Janthinobacterium lividum]